jgi:hypothetical protein
VRSRLESALSTCGYTSLSYYSTPGGFALVTRLEETSQDGTPLKGDARWRRDVGPLSLRTFSLGEYLKRLFTAPFGYYRFISFVITDRPLRVDQDKILTNLGADSLLRGGVLALPADVLAPAYSASHHCYALVYEFTWKDSDTPPVELKTNGGPSAHDHLQRAGIISALSRRN